MLHWCGHTIDTGGAGTEGSLKTGKIQEYMQEPLEAQFDRGDLFQRMKFKKIQGWVDCTETISTSMLLRQGMGSSAVDDEAAEVN